MMNASGGAKLVQIDHYGGRLTVCPNCNPLARLDGADSRLMTPKRAKKDKATLPQLGRQLRNVLAMRRASSMVSTWARVGISASFAAIDISERLPVRVQHFIAARNLLNGPRWREASHGSWFRLRTFALVYYSSQISGIALFPSRASRPGDG